MIAVDAKTSETEKPQQVPIVNVGPCGSEPTEEQMSKSDSGVLRYLSADEFGVWDHLVDISPQGSPFSRSWWLKAVSSEMKILGYFRGGSLVAGIPLYSEKRYGIRVYTMPQLTQTLGPIVMPVGGRPAAALWQEMEVLTVLAKELAKLPIFFQAFHPSLQNWAPFYWKGFSQTSRATQVVELGTAEELLGRMIKTARRSIRKAERMGITIEPCAPELLWEQEEKSFSRQGKKVPHSVDYLRGLHDAAKTHDAGGCWAAFDRERNVHSASFMIWDRKRAYTVASGADPKLRESGAHSLLIWHLAQMAAAKSPILDFAGSMLQPVELFLRSFGSCHVPYNWVMRVPLPLKLYLAARGKI